MPAGSAIFPCSLRARSATFSLAQGNSRGTARHTVRIWRSPRGSPRPIRATPDGSAISRSPTTRSAMCWWRKARSTTRSPHTARASPSASRLAKSDPGNAGWQYDLGISHERTGDVLKAKNDLAGALASYEAKRDIDPGLAKADPDNTSWQRNLSVAYDKIGDVLMAQGDLSGALQSYQADLAIAARLAAKDPSNAEWQHDLSVTYDRVGDVFVACKAISPRRFRPIARASPFASGWSRRCKQCVMAARPRGQPRQRSASCSPSKGRRQRHCDEFIEGREIIARLKEQFPDSTVLADTSPGSTARSRSCSKQAPDNPQPQPAQAAE